MRSTKLLVGIGTLMGVLSGCSTTATRPASSDLLATARIEPVERTEHGGMRATEADYALGKRYLSQGLPDMAVEAFERALHADPENAEVRNGLAHAFLLRNDLTRAEEQLQKAVIANPGASHLHSNLGYVLMQRGKLREAATALAKGVQLDPDNARAQKNWQTLKTQFANNARLNPGSEHIEPTITATGAEVVTTTSVKSTAVRPTTAAQSGAVVNIDFDRPPTAPVLTARFGNEAPTTLAATQPHTNVINMPSVEPIMIDSPSGTRQSRESAAKTARIEPTPPATDAVAIRTRIAPSQSTPSGAPFMSKVEVSNGNGVSGQAARVRARLMELDMPVYKITNAPHYNYKLTQILYRDGSRERAVAISKMLPTPSELMLFKDGYAARGVDVRVILGADLSTQDQVREIRSLPSRPTASMESAG